MKKNNDRDCCVPLLRKTIRIMKITTLFSLAVACCISASTYAQDYKVSIKKNNASIIEILKEIEKNSEFTFFFNDNHVNVNKKVSVNAKNVTLDEVLTQIFNNTGYNYQIIDRQVLIKASTEPNQATNAAQQKTKIVSGVINDETGLPVIGANVVEKGTTNGTITDAEGRFSLNVASDATLVITYIGYVTSEIPVIGKNSVTITLREDTEVLDEVIVVGYGTMKKKDLTGSVAAIKGDDLAARKTTQLSTALQGAIAGVTVTRDNNAPGAAAGSIRVRGITTIGDTSPLVIIDGVPGSINDVNPNDVESMSVLKDAASSSIYGSRAAAGVILITTKRAQEKSLSIDYNFEYGLEIPTKQPKYVGVKRFLETTNELRYNDNKSGGWNQAYSDDDINNWEKYHQTNPDKYPMTDWVGMILKGSAPRQTHTISVAGGSKTVKSNASFVYDKVDGLYADRDYERFMIRANNDFTVNKYLGATLDFNFKRTKNHQPYYSPFSDMRLAPMIYPAVWANGEYASGKNGNNPYAVVNSGGFKDEWYNQMGGRAAINITPLEGLKISGVIAPNYTFEKKKHFRKAVPYSLENDPNMIGGYMEGYNTTKLSEERNDSYNITIQGIVNYMKTFGKHDLNLMAGYETYYSSGENLGASRDQYELSNFPYLNVGPLDLRDNSGSATELSYRSWFGRVAYSFDNRYLFQANIRYDGSSRFHSDYRWGVFPSFSAGWVLSEEAFMENADINWLSFLKLRASYGTLGNERITDKDGNALYYPYQAFINFSDVLFYQNGTVVPELSAAQWAYAVENISWETTSSVDIGLDANFFNNRLRFTADYYNKQTKDMLLALEIPDYVGFDNPQRNTGKMYTNGYDIELAWNDRIGDLTYGISANFSDFVSKMGDLGGTEFLGDQVKLKDSEFNEWYGYLSDGLMLTEEDLKGPKLNDNVQLGDVKYKDISGPDGVPDGKISPEYDRVLLGGSLPRFQYGGTLNLGYKGFDFSVAIQGVGRRNTRLSSAMVQPLQANWGNTPAIIDGKYWSEKNTEAQNAEAIYPRLTYSNNSINYAMSDFWLFNGRYFRLKNLTLGYTLPAEWTEKVMIKQTRIYVAANDLFCISKYPKGWDPEMGSSAYPITTSVLFGLSVKF